MPGPYVLVGHSYGGLVTRLFDALRQQGRQVEYVEIEGDGGHLDGLLAIGKAGEAIRKLLGA